MNMLNAQETKVNIRSRIGGCWKRIARIRLNLVRGESGRRAEKEKVSLNRARTPEGLRIAMKSVPLTSKFAVVHVGGENSVSPRLRFLLANQKEGYAPPQIDGFQHWEGEMMAIKSRIVSGIVPHRINLEYEIYALKVAGFGETSLSILLQENRDLKSLATETLTKTSEGEAALPDSETIKGATPGWLLESRECNIQGDGPFLISGPHLAALTEMRDHSEEGGLTAALQSLGIPEKESMRYRDWIKDGGVLLLVDCLTAGWVDKAKIALRSIGAEIICSSLESLPD
ncbi:MAG: hypothetical protein ACRD4Y_10965 [Candidatus Acidiferrales bacterium]